MADKSTKIKRLRLSRETIIQLDALIAARRIKIHAHLRARVFIMYGVFGIHFLASTTSSFPMSAHSVRVGEKFLSSLRVINQLSTAKTFLRFSIAASAQQMHLLLPILVLCSAIFRRVFLALRSLPTAHSVSRYCSSAAITSL